MSSTAQRLMGTYLAEEKPQRPPVPEWLQQQLRLRFARVLENFAAGQPEPINIALVQLEEVKPDCLVCRVPCFLTDHESPHPFRSEVVFELNPLTGAVLRRSG
jgi:hypothetical protein